MKNQNSNNYTHDIQLPNEEIQKILTNNYYKKSMQNIDNSDVTINTLENIFTDEKYYLAMKIVPLLERKLLYLTYVKNSKLNDICRYLKLSKKQVISLRAKAIIHFKNNLYIIEKLEKGGK